LAYEYDNIPKNDKWHYFLYDILPDKLEELMGPEQMNLKKPIWSSAGGLHVSEFQSASAARFLQDYSWGMRKVQMNNEQRNKVNVGINLIWLNKKPLLYFYATRKLMSHEELFWDFGDALWYFKLVRCAGTLVMSHCSCCCLFCHVHRKSKCLFDPSVLQLRVYRTKSW
jgi:hypothetical protein